jgi:hypothetical protein
VPVKNDDRFNIRIEGKTNPHPISDAQIPVVRAIVGSLAKDGEVDKTIPHSVNSKSSPSLSRNGLHGHARLESGLDTMKPVRKFYAMWSARQQRAGTSQTPPMHRIAFCCPASQDSNSRMPASIMRAYPSLDRMQQMELRPIRLRRRKFSKLMPELVNFVEFGVG